MVACARVLFTFATKQRSRGERCLSTFNRTSWGRSMSEGGLVRCLRELGEESFWAGLGWCLARMGEEGRERDGWRWREREGGRGREREGGRGREREGEGGREREREREGRSLV